jgi:hypothetical protein
VVGDRSAFGPFACFEPGKTTGCPDISPDTPADINSAREDYHGACNQLTLMVGVLRRRPNDALGTQEPRQGNDPNAAPNPYRIPKNSAQLPAGRRFGQAIKIQVDHSDGKSIWVFDRCASNNAPIR